MIPLPVLDRIKALWPLYVQAGREQNVHPALLAAIDYRECDNDPTRSALSGERIGTPNPDNPTTTVSKLDSLQQAAAHVKEMARMVYQVVLTPTTTDIGVKLALLAYNRGFMYQRVAMGPDRSPYVMNDPADPMTWPNNAGEPPQTRGRLETGRWGAFRIYEALASATPPTGPAPTNRKDPDMIICTVPGEGIFLITGGRRVHIQTPEEVEELIRIGVPAADKDLPSLGQLPTK